MAIKTPSNHNVNFVDRNLKVAAWRIQTVSENLFHVFLYPADEEESIRLVGRGRVRSNNLSGAIAQVGQTTQEQIKAFAEMKRLLSGARRSATLAFPDSGVRLRSEFQVDIHEPADFASGRMRLTEPEIKRTYWREALTKSGPSLGGPGRF